MKINPILFFILISSVTFSNSSFSQEIVLKCSISYSNSIDIFNILISNDKTNGLMVNKSRAYILKIKSRDEEYYTFSTIPYISADNSFRIFYYTSISINRQNLQLTTHYPDENYARVLDCQRDNSDVRKLFENVKTQANVNSQNQKRDEISRKEKLLKEAQF